MAFHSRIIFPGITGFAQLRWLAIFCLLVFGARADAAPDLRFAISEGRIQNHFFRDGPVAAHAVLRSGPAARLVFAFPAGNSGVGLWLKEAAEWRFTAPLRAAQQVQPDGSLRRGIVVELEVDAASLTVERALLGSVRVLRDYGYGNPIPGEVEAAAVISGGEVSWERRRLDGGPGYALAVTVLNGRAEMRDGAVVLSSHEGGLRLRITALTGDEPLTPLTLDEIFKHPDHDSSLQQAAAFLVYREKLLAGSWQYDTYFGRDTLMTLMLMMGELRPEPIEAGLGAVLERLNPGGEVAHEEDIGEFALIGRPGHDAQQPVLDYKMVDDDFMLAPVLAAYLLDTNEGCTRAAAFLARQDRSGISFGELVSRNLGHVALRAGPFAADPGVERLVPIQDGLTVGDWRDSQNGLGGDGRYSFSINAALVPAALEAGSRLINSGLLRNYAAQEAGPGAMAAMAAMAKVWAAEAPPLFAVSLPGEEVQAHLAAFGQATGIAAPKPAAAEDIRFMALVLDEAGRPVRVMHSDVGFLLLLLQPDDAAVQAALSQVIELFPAGLMTDAGMLVANPAFAGSGRAAMFDNTRYHGTVIWSWQQGLLKAGIRCQLARADLSAGTRALLQKANAAISLAIERTRSMQGSELWSWRMEGAKIVPQPYGQAAGHETESNAAQLWSAVALATNPHCGPVPAN